MNQINGIQTNQRVYFTLLGRHGWELWLGFRRELEEAKQLGGKHRDRSNPNTQWLKVLVVRGLLSI